MKAFINHSNLEYDALFQGLGFELVSLEEANLVVFTGGWDVNPNLYNKHPHPSTRFNLARDQSDIVVYNHSKDKLKVGICRGGQFLHVMNGGTLVQDVGRHARHGTHPLECTVTGKEWNVTSTHHQMMNPLDKVGEVVGTSFETFIGLTTDGEEEATLELPTNTEVVFHDDAMCFQPHPEFYGADETANCFKHFFEMFLQQKGVKPCQGL